MRSVHTEVMLAIDPGTKQSGWVLWEPATETLKASGVEPNETVAQLARDAEAYDVCLIEKAEVIGQGNIQQEVLDTCVWVGRFLQIASDALQPGTTGKPRVHLVTRRLVKTIITGYQNIPNADTQITRHLTERFGGKGTKNAPGKLYGIKSHAWQALAVAVAFDDMRKGDYGRTTPMIKLQIEALLKESA